MSTEEPDIRIDRDDLDGIGEGEQTAGETSFGLTAYIDVPESRGLREKSEEPESRGLSDDTEPSGTKGLSDDTEPLGTKGLTEDADEADTMDTLDKSVFIDNRDTLRPAGAGKETVAVGLTAYINLPEGTGLDEKDAAGYTTEYVPVTSETQAAGQTVQYGQEFAEELAEPQDTEEDAPEDEEETGSEDGTEESEAEAEKDPEIEEIKKKIRARKKEKKRKARRRRVTFWTVLSVLLISIAAFMFSLSSFFTVDSIEVRGNSHFTPEEIINIAHAVPGHNIIYDLGSAEIIEYLEQNPYIKSASVTRKFPSTMVITVDERRQACAFKYDDDYLIMDDEGILLKKTRTEPKITMLQGLVASKIRLGDKIGTENPVMFTRTLKLIREMIEGDLYFVRVDMSGYDEDRTVRAYVYDKLVVKADYDLLLEAMSNGRLHKVLEKLFEDGVKRGTISITAEGSVSFEPGI